MLRSLAKFILRVAGWKALGEPPTVPKAVIIAAPHTSNWDGVWALLYKTALDLDVRFFAKHSLFWFPLGMLLRGLGGIPLDRSRAESAVDEAVRMYIENEQFLFGLAPEGTRSLTGGWKSGFYRIASMANVPVIPGFLNYRDKIIRIGDPIELSGDMAADMQHFAELYRDTPGCRPENASPVVIPHADEQVT